MTKSKNKENLQRVCHQGFATTATVLGFNYHRDLFDCAYRNFERQRPNLVVANKRNQN